MKRNLRMSSSILPSEICSGPRWEFAVKREMSLSELKMLAMANRASAISVGCHISHSSLGREELYWRQEKVWRKGHMKRTLSTYSQKGEVLILLQATATQDQSLENVHILHTSHTHTKRKNTHF